MQTQFSNVVFFTGFACSRLADSIEDVHPLIQQFPKTQGIFDVYLFFTAINSPS